MLVGRCVACGGISGCHVRYIYIFIVLYPGVVGAGGVIVIVSVSVGVGVGVVLALSVSIRKGDELRIAVCEACLP